MRNYPLAPGLSPGAPCQAGSARWSIKCRNAKLDPFTYEEGVMKRNFWKRTPSLLFTVGMLVAIAGGAHFEWLCLILGA